MDNWCEKIHPWLEHYPLHRQSCLSSSSIFGNRKGAEVHEAVQDVVIRTGSTGRQPKRYAGSGLGKGHRGGSYSFVMTSIKSKYM